MSVFFFCQNTETFNAENTAVGTVVGGSGHWTDILMWDHWTSVFRFGHCNGLLSLGHCTKAIIGKTKCGLY